MVRFEKDKLVIEIPAASRRDAIETWSDLHAGLCDVIYYMKQDTIIDETFFNLPLLLGEMLPGRDDIKKMAE